MCKRTFTPFVFSITFLFSSVFSYPGKVVKEYTAPGGFCTAMTFDGKFLWVADYKEDKLFKLNPETGEQIDHLPSPGFWPTGLAWDGTNLWVADSKQKKIFKVSARNGAVLKTIEAPSDAPEGLAWDGKTLWVSDRQKKEIMKIDLSDGTAVHHIPAPAQYPQDLTFDGTYLWCADRISDELYMIDPDSGDVLVICKSPGPYPRGLAWDGQYLWNVDYQTDKIYKIVRQDQESYVLNNTRHCKITFTHEMQPYGQGKILQAHAYIAIPEDKPQQKIINCKFLSDNYSLKSDRWQQQVADFTYENLTPQSKAQSIMVVEAEISEINYFIFPDRCGTLADIPEAVKKTYSANGSKYMTDDPYIQKITKDVVGDEKNPYRIARNIFDFVRNTLEYKLEGGWNVAPVVLKRGTGSCSEYSFSFIALCRAAGLPARYVGAIVVRGDDASFDDVFHRWPEIYLPNYGWVPFDPQGGDKPSPRDRALNIGHLSNRFLITTQGGGDSEYLGWYYNSFESFQTDPQVKVEMETFAEWEPLMPQ